MIFRIPILDYFQNAAWIWRGLAEHARCLQRAGEEHSLPELQAAAKRYAAIASEMRGLIERALQTRTRHLRK